ncbi:peptide deformylase [Paracoccus beibuensis]|uniref:peptide deformylase n=1 Tax=Paracoccus beibuensis TaxID=547602 RepID=UPI0022400087|nr:peptide deformylase [Paracoccus beibuensis]
MLPAPFGSGIERDLVLWPDPRLRQPCEPAGYLKSPNLHALAADLLATMYAAGARGLAAPQVGNLRRIFVMDAGWKNGDPEPLVMLDPEILWRSPQTEVAVEACLSIPGHPVEVERPAAITLGWYDLDGKHQKRQLTGTHARIAQHEVDHLDGRLIVKD